MGRLTQELGEVVLTPNPEGRLSQELAEVVLIAPQHGRLSQELAEVVLVAPQHGRLSQLFVEVVARFATPVAFVPDITSFVSVLTSLDASGSTGSAGDSTYLTEMMWSWTSVPGGSAIANITPTPMPDSGATTFIAMTNNEVLYHCEGSGTDSSGNGNTATFSNVTTGAAGKVGANAWSFDTDAGIATMTSGVTLGASWTIAFWFFDLEPDTGYRTGCHDVGPTVFPIIVVPTTNLLGTWNGSLQSSGFAMPSASFTGWHHMVAVGSGTTTAYYVDGTYVGTAPIKATTAMRYLGNQIGQTQRFAKRLDEIAIWTRALTDTEITALYVNQSGNHAGSGSSLSFIPDVAGTYTAQFSMNDTNLRGGPYTDTANAVITLQSFYGIWPMERHHAMPGIQGQRLKRHRGQM
jgi:hypothetical protein